MFRGFEPSSPFLYCPVSLQGSFIMAGTTSGFADGRHEVSPDSEQMEQTATVLLLRNSGSVEQIQDRREEPSRLKTKKSPQRVLL